MKLLITGGGGFIGSRLTRALLDRGTLAGREISQVVLADQVAPRAEIAADRRVKSRVGPLLGQCADLGKEGFDGVKLFKLREEGEGALDGGNDGGRTLAGVQHGGPKIIRYNGHSGCSPHFHCSCASSLGIGLR